MVEIYRGSELGGCLRAQIARRLGYVKLDQTKVAMKNGTLMEELWDEGKRLEDIAIEKLTFDGYKITHQQLEIDIPVIGNVIIQLHIDGLIDSATWRNFKLLEVKSMRPASFQAALDYGWEMGGFMDKYKWQVSIYMHGLRFYFGDPNIEACLSIIDSEPGLNDDDRRIFQLYTEQPFYSLAEIKQRVILAESWVRRGELPPGCDYPSFPCPVFYLHDEGEFEGVSDEVLDSAVIELKEAQRLKKIGEDREKEARKLLTKIRDSQPESARSSKKKRLDNGEEVVLESVKVKTDTGTRVTWYEQMNPPSFNREAAIADGVDLGKYKKQDKSWRIRAEREKESGGDHDRE